MARIDRSFDLLAIDAFSSNSIPIHLITLEAIGLYLSRLRPGGIIALHISNRYVDLEPVLAAISDQLGLISAIQSDSGGEDEAHSGSTWVLLVRDYDDFGALLDSEKWMEMDRIDDLKPWRDDYSNLFKVLNL